MDRLKNKIAVVIGAGQSPGEEMGLGRATTLRFLQEGAKVLATDLNLESAQETLDVGKTDKDNGFALKVDASDTESVRAVIEAVTQRWGRIDILHYNVGISIMAGPQLQDEITDEAFDKTHNVNLRGAVMACKFALPIMRAQGSGSITLVSSMSAIETFTPNVAYRTSKAGLLSYMQLVSAHNADAGVRCNAILPGRMQTSMAVDTRMRTTGKSRDEIIAERNARVPLRNKGGSAWDIANAALFLNSDEADFITGVALPVDGGTLARIGW